jgi:prepilin peptidase CpaA
MSVLPFPLQLALALLVLSAAIYDFRFRRIPNWLNLSGLILGFGLNLFCFHWRGPLISIEGLLIAAAIYLPLYMLRGMGAGDVKLMAAVGAIAGPNHWLAILLATALTGGIAGAVYAWVKGRFTEVCCNLYFILKDIVRFRQPHKTNPQLDFRNPASLRMPHGVIIAVGCFAFLAIEYSNPKLLSNLLH